MVIYCKPLTLHIDADTVTTCSAADVVLVSFWSVHGLPSNLASHYYYRTSHRTNYQCKFIGKYNTPAKERTSYLLTNYLRGACILCSLCNKHYPIKRPCWDVLRKCKIWERRMSVLNNQYIPGITTHWAVQWQKIPPSASVCNQGRLHIIISQWSLFLLKLHLEICIMIKRKNKFGFIIQNIGNLRAPKTSMLLICTHHCFS